MGGKYPLKLKILTMILTKYFCKKEPPYSNFSTEQMLNLGINAGKEISKRGSSSKILNNDN